MIPIGALQFREYNGSGPNTGRKVICGNLDFGHVMDYDPKDFPDRSDRNEHRRAIRNEIRRRMWDKVYGELMPLIREARRVSVIGSEPWAVETTEKAFKALQELVEYNARISDEPEPMKPLDRKP